MIRVACARVIGKKFLQLVSTVLLAVLAGHSCREPFDANNRESTEPHLVVEGYIDVAADAVTTIKLSRTSPLREVISLLPEENAKVFVEDENGMLYPLTERDPGTYSSAELNLNPTLQYRIKILLTSGDLVLSDYAKAIVTSPIDSVSWAESEGGVTIFVGTHAEDAATTYYQWTYEEVWEKTVPFLSFAKYENGVYVGRTTEEIKSLKTCWVYISSKKIETAVSALYLNGLIPRKEIFYIPRFDERLMVRYSMTVNQLALSRDNFNFLEILKKNGNIGGLSDPMPAVLQSNLHSETTDLIVGFIGVNKTEKKRVEIYADEVSNWNPQSGCEESEDFVSPEDYSPFQTSYLPTRLIVQEGVILAAKIAPGYCVDCRFQGGTMIRPSFWPAEDEN